MMVAENKVMSCTAAILAGGKARRMGGVDKALLTIDGTPMIERALEQLRGMFKEIMIVTNTPAAYKAYEKECTIVTDVIKDAGPLGGIHAGLVHASGETVFFMAGDMPNIHNGLVRRLLKLFQETQAAAAVPRVGQRIEPLHGVYAKKLGTALGEYINHAASLSVRNYLTTVNTAYLELEDIPEYRDAFANINTPEELQTWTARA
jgi:molybdopterin-guanine dinucleotide biosynthesis protein A